MSFTVLGAEGFIGSHLALHLEAIGESVVRWGRDEAGLAGGGNNHGDVIDCAGLTSDFRTRPLDTVEAHVCRVKRNLETMDFESYLWLSSTRVYKRLSSACEEDNPCVDPSDPDDIYNISKAMGESLCLTDPRPTVRVVRLSNVYGLNRDSETFLSTLIVAGLADHRIELAESPESERDYVSIGDVVGLLPRIAISGRRRLYNIAAGRNDASGDVAALVADLTGATLTLNRGGTAARFPQIAVDRIVEEFGFAPSTLSGELPALVAAYEKELSR